MLTHTRHILLIVASVILLSAITGCSSDYKHVNIPSDILHEGDIAFRRGSSIVSQAVLFGDVDGKYSHVGIIVKIGNDWHVVHAVPGEHEYEGDFDRVRIVTLDNFFAPQNAEKGAIMRIPLSSDEVSKISEEAIELANQHIPFDHSYRLDDRSQLYCTELIQNIFNSIGINLSQGRTTQMNIPGINGDFLMPSDIYLNPSLQTIFIF